MSDNKTTGIPNPDKPGHWLVPPWAKDASFCDVVLHFLRFDPWDNTNTAHLRAYYEGYQRALDAAPANELEYAGNRRWFADMRDCVGRCARLFQEERAVTGGRRPAA